ncbi:MAG: alpha/beta hydrolase-fold protein [Ignavibacteriaceae bacterium]
MRKPIQEGWFNPALESVGLRGDRQPLSWDTTSKATDSDNNGIYHLSLPFQLEEDSLTISLKIKVDGVNNPNDGWQIGRNHLITIRRDVPNILKIAWDDEAPPPQSTISGHVEIIHNFESGKLESRDIYVYLPPDYFGNDNHYPVLYMHDGQNLFDVSATGQEWGLDEAAESLIHSGKIKPLIIVGIGNTKNRINEYTPTRQIWHHVLQRQTPPDAEGALSKFTGTFVTESDDSIHFSADADTLFAMIPGSQSWQKLTAETDSVFYLPQAGITFQFHQNMNGIVDRVNANKPPMGGDGNIYSDFLIKTLKPFIDQKFRTRPEKEWTALGGSSLGGLITLYIGLKHSEIFSQLFVLSPSVWWDNRQILKTVQTLKEPTNQRILLYAGTGEGEKRVKNLNMLKNKLIEKGWAESQIEYIVAPDAEHNERAWAEQAKNMLLFLFRSE